MEFTFDQYKGKEEKDTPINRSANSIPTRSPEKITPTNTQQQITQSAKPSQSVDLRNRINDNQSARPSVDLANRLNQSTKPLQSLDLRNRINEKRDKQITDVIDLTVDDSDGSKDSRYSDKKPLPTNPSRINDSANKQEPTKPANVHPSANAHPPLAKNNPFYFDVGTAPYSAKMQDRLNVTPKLDAPSSKLIQNVNTNTERKSVMDRIQAARQAPPVPNVSNSMF